MLARCVATLKPPPELTLSQWADRYRMLSAESSAEPGRWHTDKAPYQREIMDAIGDAHIRRVVIMCAAQLGKTELLLNILGYFMAYAPAPILVMQPTLDMGQTFSKDRLAPMIRDTPVLRGLVDVKSRYAGNTILKKNFPGGHITIVGANSATGLASRPIKVLLADEVDRYPGSAGTEGDPLSLAQKRQTTFWDKKTVMVSTPVIKGHSRIETEYNQSTREEWNVPCPECGHYQPFVWANLIFDPDDLQKEIVYKCERCGCVANEYRWKQQSQQGRFVAENPGAETRGFHLNTLASTFCGWKEIVQKFIVAKEQLDQGNPEGMKVWVNTELGETWEERGEQVEDTELFNRREIYDAVVPEEVLVLTAGVDVQDDRFEVEIVGWGVGKESWGIRYQKIYGDMLKEQVWEDLDAFLQTVWCKKDGTALRIISCCMKIIEKNEGKKINYNLTGTKLDFADGALTLDLARYQQDDTVTRDIMVDSEGYLTTGRGLYYAAQVEIPARKYTETVTTAQETDAQAEGGENTEGMSRETVTRTPEPLDTEDVTLYLFALDGIMIH